MPPAEPQAVRDICKRWVGRTGAPIGALREVVATLGHITPSHMEAAAHVFNLSVAEVRGIVSFYADLRTQPQGRRHIRLCQAEACQAVGARELTAAAQRRLGIALGETAADGSVSLEAVYCLGLCAAGPSAMVDGRPIARATVEALLG